MKSYETFEIGFQGQPLGMKFVQTVDAPEDYVKIHPFMVARLLKNNSLAFAVDIFKGESDAAQEG